LKSDTRSFNCINDYKHTDDSFSPPAQGKGSGLSDLFGGGISSNYGGSSVVEKNLDRITIVAGGIWFSLVVALSLLLK